MTKLAELNALISQNSETVDIDILLKVLHKQLAKSALRTSTQLYETFKNEGLFVTTCKGRWGASAINQAAIELGFVEKRKVSGFDGGFNITAKGKSLGVKRKGYGMVLYSSEATELLRNFFLAHKHKLHAFVAID